MTFERRVHRAIELQELARVFAEQMRPEFAQTSAHALRIRGQIKRAERAHLAVADQARVGFNADNRAVEDGDRFSAGPFVSASRAAEARLDKQRCG